MLSSRFTAHEPDTAITIAASYAAKAFGIKTGTLAREARQLCPNVIPVQANHRLYTDYPERILATVDTCLPIEKIMPFDGMVCRLTSAERQANQIRAISLAHDNMRGIQSPAVPRI